MQRNGLRGCLKTASFLLLSDTNTRVYFGLSLWCPGTQTHTHTHKHIHPRTHVNVNWHRVVQVWRIAHEDVIKIAYLRRVIKCLCFNFQCNALAEHQLILDAYRKLNPEQHLVVIGGGCPASSQYISLGALYYRIPQVNMINCTRQRCVGINVYIFTIHTHLKGTLCANTCRHAHAHEHAHIETKTPTKERLTEMQCLVTNIYLQILYERQPSGRRESSSIRFPITVRADRERTVLSDVARFVHSQKWQSLILVHDDHAKTDWLDVYGIKVFLSVNVTTLRQNENILKVCEVKAIVACFQATIITWLHPLMRKSSRNWRN